MKGERRAERRGEAGTRGYGGTGPTAAPERVEKHLTFREKVIINFKNRGKESKTGYESGDKTLCEFSRISSSGK